MQQGVTSGFDLAAHQRDRIRALERLNASLERQRNQLERLLAHACTIASPDDPLTLLRVLERLDNAHRGPSVDELVTLLRETSSEVAKQEVAAA